MSRSREAACPRPQRLGDDVIGNAHALRIEALAGLGVLMKKALQAKGSRGRGPGRGKGGVKVDRLWMNRPRSRTRA